MIAPRENYEMRRKVKPGEKKDALKKRKEFQMVKLRCRMANDITKFTYPICIEICEEEYKRVNVLKLSILHCQTHGTQPTWQGDESIQKKTQYIKHTSNMREQVILMFLDRKASSAQANMREQEQDKKHEQGHEDARGCQACKRAALKRHVRARPRQEP